MESAHDIPESDGHPREPTETMMDSPPAPRRGIPEDNPCPQPILASGSELTEASAATSLDDELKGRGTQLALMVEVHAALAGAIDAESVLGEILSRLRERARLTNVSIFLLNFDDRRLRCVAQSGYPTVEDYKTLDLDGPGLVAWVARTAEALYVPDVAKDVRYLSGDPRILSEYAVPLVAGSKVVGVLDIQSDRRDGLRAVTGKLVDQIASQAALAIERGELYKQLRESEQRFRSIFEQNYFGVALCSLEGKLSTVNSAFARLLGYEPEELRNMHFADITHPDDRERSLESTRSLLEGEDDHLTLEKRYVRKSGETVWAKTILSVIRGPASRPAYQVAMIQDITQRKKAEEERARLEEQLFQAQKMGAIGTLTGGIAHDFNNFLGAILGFASLLRLRLHPDDPLQDPVRLIEQSAESAADLTRQLLGLARPEKMRAGPVSVGEILDRVGKIVKGTFDRRIRVEMRLASELPWIHADSIQLEQAILNLSINARDAMPEGGTLTFETSLATLEPADPTRPAQCPAGEYVRIGVRDTGAGMNPQEMARIFEPFFTTKPPGRGTGLGLAMVTGIVRKLGGFVHVESEPGRGSEFAIYLPPVPAGGAQEPVPRKEPAQLQPGSGTVLVVDDEPVVLAFAEQGLKRLGYQVVTAETGESACEVYRSRSAEIDCVLLDMVMPEIGGFEIYKRLREINPQVRVIMSSGYSEGRVARQALESGVSNFLGKPYTLETLSNALKQAQAG